MSDIVGHNESLVIIACNTCCHNRGDFTCDAFPDGIPDIVLSGKNDHRKPLLEQRNDLVYEPIKKGQNVSS